MTVKELDENIDKVVRYDHKGLDPIFPVLQGLYIHKVNGYRVCSAVLLDKTGSTYYALPHEVSAVKE